ncbi:MAG: transposase [Solirubrobacteraceae bacterium]
MTYLGLTPCEDSSGAQQHRGHITKAGNTHRQAAADRGRLELSAPAPPVRPRRQARERGPGRDTARAWQAQTRLFLRHRTLTQNGKRSTVATTAVAH